MSNDGLVIVAAGIFLLGIIAAVSQHNYGTAILACGSALGMGGILRRAA